MSEPINDGGPAFPTTPQMMGYAADMPGAGTGCGPGMTLRDYFAANESLTDWDQENAVISNSMAEALAGRKRPNSGWDGDCIEMLKWEADWRAALKYIRADAMLRAREPQ